MRASLVSREVMADSIELVARGNLFDALIVLVGCDKTIPAGVMALARLDIPGLVLYGGSIAPGRFQNRDVTIQDVFEAVGARDAGTMSDADFDDLERHACPGAGACGGQFTANTMATVCETLGISPFGSASVPAVDVDKRGRGDKPRGPWSSTCSAAASGRARSSRAPRSRMPSPPLPRPAVRPTRCCTCSRSPTKRACPWTSTISIASAQRSRSSPT